MTSIERTAYPRLFKYKNYLKRDLAVYEPQVAEIEYMNIHLRNDVQKLNFAVQLKTFQKLGHFISFTDVPNIIIHTIRKSLDINKDIPLGYANKTDCYRHRERIRKFLEITPWNQSAHTIASNIALSAAQTLNDPADIINFMLEELISLRYELPAFSTLDRIAGNAKANVNRKIFEEVTQKLTRSGLTNVIDNLLNLSPLEGYTSYYQAFKKLPKSPSFKNFKNLLEHHDFLMRIGDFSQHLDQIPSLKFSQFVEEAKSLDVSDVKNKLSEGKKYTLTACLAVAAQKAAKDALATTFCKIISKAHKDAERELQEIIEARDAKSQQLTNLLLQLTLDFRNQKQKEFLKSLQLHYHNHGGIDKVIATCEEVIALQSNNYLPLLWRHYKPKKSLTLAFIKNVQLASSTQDQRLMQAINVVVAHHKKRSEWLKLKEELDLSFTGQPWHKLIYGENKKIINKKHLEACVVSLLAKELNCGDTFIYGAEQYADFRQNLLDWQACEPLVREFCKEASLPSSPQEFTTFLKNKLHETARRVDEQFLDNKFVSIDKKGLPILKKRAAKTNPRAETLLADIKKRLPERNVLDVLCLTHNYTGWAHSFAPLSGSEPKLGNPIERYIATTFCYGTSMGPNQTTRHLKADISAHMFSWINRRHVNLKRLDAALVKLVDYYIGFPLVKVWGPGKRCAVDGTLRNIYDDNLLAEMHIRYGAKGGISFHYVADNYIAFFSTFMACGVWEAVAIIEGLLKNLSQLQPDTVHGDTQSQSAVVFGLAYMFNIKLMPRIRNWKDLTFYKADKNTKYKHIDNLFSDTIDWNLIKTHWQDLLQVAMSIKQGKISSTTLLRKLTNNSNKNRLFKAFQELGRVVRTIFLLEYIESVELREIITETTNKVETYHTLSKWVEFATDFIARTNDPYEMEKAIKYNSIITNSLILQNVIDISSIIQELRREKWSITSADLACLSPYLTEHFKRFGDYIINLNQKYENPAKLRLQEAV